MRSDDVLGVMNGGDWGDTLGNSLDGMGGNISGVMIDGGWGGIGSHGLGTSSAPIKIVPVAME